MTAAVPTEEAEAGPASVIHEWFTPMIERLRRPALWLGPEGLGVDDRAGWSRVPATAIADREANTLAGAAADVTANPQPVPELVGELHRVVAPGGLLALTLRFGASDPPLECGDLSAAVLDGTGARVTLTDLRVVPDRAGRRWAVLVTEVLGDGWSGTLHL